MVTKETAQRKIKNFVFGNQSDINIETEPFEQHRARVFIVTLSLSYCFIAIKKLFNPPFSLHSLLMTKKYPAVGSDKTHAEEKSVFQDLICSKFVNKNKSIKIHIGTEKAYLGWQISH